MLSKLGRCAALLVLTACGIDLKVPPTTEIACNTGDDCPADFICLVTIQRCVRQGGDISLPRVTDVSIAPRLASRGTTVEISITSDIALASAPEVSFTWGGDVPGRAVATPVSSNGTFHVLHYEVGDEEIEGFLTLSSRLFSTSGVPNTFDLPRAVELDFTAPQLVPNTARIELTAPAASLRSDVTAVTVASTLTTYFAVNEPLADGVIVQIAPDGQTFVCTAPLGTFYTCTATTNTATDGVFSITASMTDLAGNQSTHELGTFVADATPPAAPTNGAELVLHRSAHGSAETGGGARLWLTAGAGTVEPGALVLAWDRESATNAIEIARTTATADGALPGFILPGVDRVDVYVQAVDSAGNASNRVHVLDGVWTATLGGKQPYETFANPHRLVEEPFFLPARDVPNSEANAYASVSDVDGTSLVTRGGPVFNRGPASTGKPGPRGGCGMSFDTNNGIGVLFGGWWSPYSGATMATSDETWTWGGYGWTQQFPETKPTSRGSHAMVFDQTRGNTVVFGGCRSYDCAGAAGDTWTYDGDNWTRVCWPGCTPGECSCDAMPAPRGELASFYDPFLGEVIVFGGHNGATVYDDTWAWNGTTWRLVPTPTRPAGRLLAQVATNTGTGQTMLLGGRTTPRTDPSNTNLSDTWFWSNGSWSLASASGGPGSGAWALVFDHDSGQYSSLFMPSTQRQLWNGSSWTFLNDLTVTPIVAGDHPGEQDGCSTYDSVRRSVVRFGGCQGGQNCNISTGFASDTTWVYRNVANRELDPGYHPTRRASSGIVALPATAEVKLVMGQSERQDRARDGVYTWNGVTWIGAPDQEGTGGISDMAMSFIDGTRIVRYGGKIHAGNQAVATYWSTDATTWSSWSGNVALYPQPAGASTYPVSQAMVYRPGKGGVFFRGSSGGVTTWVANWVTNYGPWSGQGSTSGVLWTAKPSATSPASPGKHALATCPGQSGVILFGGQNGGTYLDETWRWDETWTKLSPAHSPSARAESIMFCDTTRNVLFLIGGVNGSGELDDVWEWDGADWRDVTPRRRPAARREGMATYMPWRAEGIIFGGYNAGGYLDDTWIIDGGAASSPAHVFSASFSEAAVWDDSTIAHVDVTWLAGGVGYSGTTPTNGARLLVWDGGRWRDTGVTSDGDPASPTSLAWSTTTDPEWTSYGAAERTTRIRRLFVGGEQGLGFAVAPRGTNAQQAGGAQIASDYVEVKVGYRLTP